MQVDLRLALSLPGEADVSVMSISTGELVEGLTLVGYNGPSATEGTGHEFLVRKADGAIASRSAASLGLTEGADRIAFFAANADISAISVA
jgi:hypothetical protein